MMDYHSLNYRHQNYHYSDHVQDYLNYGVNYYNVDWIVRNHRIIVAPNGLDYLNYYYYWIVVVAADQMKLPPLRPRQRPCLMIVAAADGADAAGPVAAVPWTYNMVAAAIVAAVHDNPDYDHVTMMVAT